MLELTNTGARLKRRIRSQSKITDKKVKKMKKKIARQKAVKVNQCQKPRKLKQKFRSSQRARNNWKKTHSLKNIMMRMVTSTGLESQVEAHRVPKKLRRKNSNRMW